MFKFLSFLFPIMWLQANREWGWFVLFLPFQVIALFALVNALFFPFVIILWLLLELLFGETILDYVVWYLPTIMLLLVSLFLAVPYVEKNRLLFKEVSAKFSIIGAIFPILFAVFLFFFVKALDAAANEMLALTGFKKAFATINQAMHAEREFKQFPNGMNVETLISDVFEPPMKIKKRWENGFQTIDGITYLFKLNKTKNGVADCQKIPSDIKERVPENACFLVFVDVTGIEKRPNKPTTMSVKGLLKDRFMVMIFEDGAILGDSVAGDVFVDNIARDKASAKKGSDYTVNIDEYVDFMTTYDLGKLIYSKESD